MRINSHAHIFNLKSVLTKESVDIITNRLGRGGMPKYVLKALKEVLIKLLKKGGEYTGRAMLEDIVDSVIKDEGFKLDLKNNGDDFPSDLKIVLNGDVKDLAVDTLDHFVGGIIKKFSKGNKDVRNQTLSDYIGFIRIGLLPSIDEVTDHLMQQLAPNDIVVPLMMDITEGGDKDEELFLSQMDDTSRQIVRYPGRILPFVKVNPKRVKYFEFMKMAIEEKGFVGVKLYPSLGYTVTNNKMKKVFKYCNDNDVPVLYHCNHGGFFKNKSDIENGNPALWDKILRDNPKLKVCFGHFGGDEPFLNVGIQANSWTGVIIKLMKKYPGRAFADISYHTNPMDGGVKEKNYFNNLKLLLRTAKVKDQILWGTDYFLVRQRLSESVHWDYFESHLSKANFKKITSSNPQSFLGLNAKIKGEAENIDRYVKFLDKNKSDIEGGAAKWILARAKSTDIRLADHLSPLGSQWTKSNYLHRVLYGRMRKKYFSSALKEDYEFESSGRLLLLKIIPRMDSPNGNIKSEVAFKVADYLYTLMSASSVGMHPGYGKIEAVIKIQKNLLKAKQNLMGLSKELDKIFILKGEV